MSDNITPDMMLGLTTEERAAADRLELTPGVDLLLHHSEPVGWEASLITSTGQYTATGDAVGAFLMRAAKEWANPII